MSIDQATDFIQVLLDNPGMKGKLEKCSTINKRLEFAKSLGYDVNIDDIKEVTSAFNSGLKVRVIPVSGCLVVTAESEVNYCCVYNIPAPQENLNQ